jgi:hypothetical protein
MSRDIEKPDKCNPPLVKPSGPSLTVEPTEVCTSTGISPMPANHSMQGNHSRKRCESSAARHHCFPRTIPQPPKTLEHCDNYTDPAHFSNSSNSCRARTS